MRYSVGQPRGCGGEVCQAGRLTEYLWRVLPPPPVLLMQPLGVIFGGGFFPESMLAILAPGFSRFLDPRYWPTAALNLVRGIVMSSG